MENKESVVRKVSALVASRFGGDWRAAFDFYATRGLVSESALKTVLRDAGVGTALSRTFVAGAVLSEVDANGDRAVSYAEFLKVAQV